MSLRDRIEALAAEWEQEAARRERDAKSQANDRKALKLGASFETAHALALRRALSEDAAPAPADTMMGCPRCHGAGFVPMAARCACTHEAGDSPCPLHGMDEEAAPAPRGEQPAAAMRWELRPGHTDPPCARCEENFRNRFVGDMHSYPASPAPRAPGDDR